MRVVHWIAMLAVCLAVTVRVSAQTQITTAGIEGASSAGGGSVATVKLVAETLPATKRDPAERSARSIECAQKADAEGLQGKMRKHFLRECKRGS